MQEMLKLTAKHFVQPWHRKRRSLVFENGNWRSGDLHKRGIIFQAYGDWHSKATGEVDCLHIEAKITGSAVLRRLGINHPIDLISWQESKFWERHLSCFYDVDRRKLGCSWNNRIDGTKKRLKPVPENGFHYDINRATGNFLCRMYGRDEEGLFLTQRLVDRIGRGSWLKKMPLLRAEMDANCAETYEDRKTGNNGQKRA